MSNEPSTPRQLLADARGLCWFCNYDLRGLPVNVCPECGRAFDPNDRRTMNLGRAMGRLARWVCRPMGWRVVLAALVLVGAMAACSRLPVGTWRASLVDVRWYAGQYKCLWRGQGWTLTDRVYTAAVLAWPVVAGLWLMRMCGRWVAVRAYRQPKDLRPRRARPHLAMGVLLGIAAGLAVLCWPYRIAQHWVACAGLPQPAGGPQWAGYRAGPPCSVTLNDWQRTAVLRSALVRLGSVRERTVALKLIVEQHAAEGLPIVMSAAPKERDSDLRSAELLVIGMYHAPDTAPLLLGELHHPDPAVRAAAADALGLLHSPAYPVPLPPLFFGQPALLNTKPPIDLDSFLATTSHGNNWPAQGNWSNSLSPIALSPDVRLALERLMTEGGSPVEREAAARALVAWPPDKYRLRLAEWGVWISNTQGQLCQSQLDEIPPFVHRMGNTRDSLQSRLNQVYIIHKPVIHMTAGRPLAVDLEVLITWGRPWVAYPRADDFTMAAELRYDAYERDARGQYVKDASGAEKLKPPLLKVLDNPALTPDADLREAYPWLTPPQHRTHGDIGGSMGATDNDAVAIGLRWQSLIVTPQKLPWMTPPAVGEDAKFAWWSRLREAPCSWVSSRGEAERFVYYDGPTLLKSPMTVCLDGRTLIARVEPAQSAGEHGPAIVRASSWEGLYIEVTGGATAGMATTLDEKRTSFDLPPVLPLKGDAVAAKLRAILLARGMNQGEAAALMDCWKAQWFQTPGRRFLLLMSREEYDSRCPLKCRPAPTEQVRVGIVLTEL